MRDHVMKRLWGDRWSEVVEAFDLFAYDWGREPDTLWELAAYVEVIRPNHQRLLAAVYERARKYEPGGRVTETDKARHQPYAPGK
jgi:hypothetical protein